MHGNSGVIYCSGILVLFCISCVDPSNRDTVDHDLWPTIINNDSVLNGVRVNGVRVNGVRVNGVRVNGVAMDGLTVSNTVLQGVSPHDGSLLIGRDFIGAEMTAELADGETMTVRVQNVEEFPGQSDIYYYTIEYMDYGQWVNICEVNTLAIPLRGVWDKSGDHIDDGKRFSFACQGSAVAKCIEWGYARWDTALECLDPYLCDERSLADFHQACTRMVRADYCGDGTAHTRDGTTIDIWDALGIMEETPDSGLELEAEWTVDGAACIIKTRWSKADGGSAVDHIRAHCPGRWAHRTSQCGKRSSNFHTLVGYRVPTKVRRLLRNSSGDNVEQ